MITKTWRQHTATEKPVVVQRPMGKKQFNYGSIRQGGTGVGKHVCVTVSEIKTALSLFQFSLKK
jgi:hypothetical protein